MFDFSNPTDQTCRNVYFTGEEIETLMHFWVTRLGLQAWQFTLAITRQPDMNREGAQGAVAMTHSRRFAGIQLLDPRDHRPETDLPYDMEQVLVHELLHILFLPLDRAQGMRIESDTILHDVCIEHPVDRIAAALVALRRATETKKSRMGVYADG